MTSPRTRCAYNRACTWSESSGTTSSWSTASIRSTVSTRPTRSTVDCPNGSPLNRHPPQPHTLGLCSGTFVCCLSDSSIRSTRGQSLEMQKCIVLELRYFNSKSLPQVDDFNFMNISRIRLNTHWTAIETQTGQDKLRVLCCPSRLRGRFTTF